LKYVRLLRRAFQKLKFITTYLQFKNKSANYTKRFELSYSERLRCLGDDTAKTGFDRHYIYHPAWAARIVKQTNPPEHIDISSTLYFCSIVSAFITVKFYDFRPANLQLTGFTSGEADLTRLFFTSNSILSLSCMHTVEHIGLGRYGDPLDYDGDLKAMKELARVLAPAGNLLFVVPVGNQAIIQFNAHRIYTKEIIIALFSGFGLTLKEFTLIPENEQDGGLILNPDEALLSHQKYGCGCFWFTK
jgi:SAM-dependent methyltransferase